jgi:2-oxoglutarate ferredoxin oxidoreductase subunit beta
VPSYEEIDVEYAPGTVVDVKMHDGSRLTLRKIEEDYDPRDKIQAVHRLMEAEAKDEVLTGILYVNTTAPTFVDQLKLVDAPLNTLPESAVRPPREALEEVMARLR